MRDYEGLAREVEGCQAKIVSWKSRPEKSQERDISGQGRALQERVFYFLLKKGAMKRE